jgi:hypothetical protein
LWEVSSIPVIRTAEEAILRLMRVRVTLAMLSAAACLPLWAPTASAHQPTEFGACAKPVDSVCATRIQVRVSGSYVVVLRARVRPPHEGATARVWRLRPHSDEWKKVALRRVREQGRIRWAWSLGDEDIYNFTPWRFRFAIPHHGHSDTVRVLIRSSEF